MKQGQKLWTREELVLALNLYYQMPFGKMHKSNPEVIELATVLNRTSGSIAYKLVNFASLDPSLQARGIKGASNVSKLDKTVWAEFYHNWEALICENEKVSVDIGLNSLAINEINEPAIPYQIAGKEKEVIRRVRINQGYFRKMILASYNNTCCITGIKQPELLIAGHIKPWAVDEDNRVNPHNGILINSLHDKAFETGLITIDTDYKIKISSELLQSKDKDIKPFFTPYNNKQIILPTKLLPNKEFLEYHNDERFRG